MADKPEPSVPPAPTESPKKKVVTDVPLREVYILPADAEPAWPLTRTELGILLQGELIPAEDTIRWGAFGAFATAVGTLIGLYFTITPTEIFAKGIGPTVAYLGFLAFTFSMVCLLVMAQLRLKQLRPNPGSPYSNLKQRIEAHLNKPIHR